MLILRSIIFLLVVMALCLPPTDMARAERQRLRLSLQLPITSHIGVNLEAFRQDIENRTDKAIEIEIVDNARAFDDQKIADAVATGKIEMGVINITNLAKWVPAIDVFQQPFLFNFDALVRAATDPNRAMRPLIDRAVLQTAGIRILWWQPYGSTVMFSKARAATSPVEIQGRPVRTMGPTASEFVRQCGGRAELIAANKQRDALQTGAVDFVMTGITGVESRKLWEVADTVTRTELAAIEFVVGIGEQAWARLSADQQKLFEEAARKAETELRQRNQEIEDAAYAFARAKGMTIVALQPEQIAEWRACSAPVMDAFMNESGDLGRQLMLLYGELRKDECCSGADTAVVNRF